MLAGIYVVYILGLGIFRPEMVPAVSKEERDLVSRGELAGKLLRVVLPPLALVGAVLGSIIAGVAAPTEAASMGALGAIVVTAIGGRHVMVGAAGNDLCDHPHHRHDDVYPDVRAGLLAFLPRPSGRKTGAGFLRIPARRHQCRHLVPDVHHLHPRLLHRVDRDLLHRGAAVPADFHRRQGRHGLARDPDLRELADLVPHPAVRLGAVLPARRRAARDHHRRHLSRHRAVRGDAAPRAGDLLSSFRSLRSGCRGRSAGRKIAKTGCALF